MRLENVTTWLIELDIEAHSSSNALAFGPTIASLILSLITLRFVMDLPTLESVIQTYKVTVNHHLIDVRFRLVMQRKEQQFVHLYPSD